MKKLPLLLLCVIGLCVGDFSRTYAQASGGSVSGTLTDAAGAARPNATVTLENIATGQRFTATTDTNGYYRVDALPPGRYRVLLTTTTATPAPAQEIAIDAGTPATVNLTLPSGPSTDSFIQAETVPTSSTPASIARTYNQQYALYQPEPNFVDRDGSAYGAYNLGLLTEATAPNIQGSNAGPAVGGQRPTSNSYNIDGMDNNNKVNPGPLVYMSNEATTDFSLFLNQPSPNFGHAAGGKFNSFVRNGSNGWHGQIYDYLQNRNLNAKDRRFNTLGLSDPGYDQNRLGASLGGALIPSKLFFFGNFEWIPLHSSLPYGGISYAPTAAGFATLRGMPNVSATNLGILQRSVGNFVGPATTTATINGVSVPLGQVSANFPLRQDQFVGTGAMDFTPWDHDRFSVRYVHNELGSNNAFGGLPGFNSSNKDKAQMADGAWYHTFTHLTNELRFGWNQYAQYTPLTNNFSLPGFSNFPNLLIGTDTNIFLGQSFGPYQGANFNTYHLADGANINFGRNELKFGFDGRRYIGRYTGFTSNLGNYSYSSLGRFLQDLPPDVMASQSFFGSPYIPNQWLLEGYAMDTFRFRPSVTLDAGVRYEYTTIPTGAARQNANSIASVPGLISFNSPQSSTNNWGPFVGIAVSPFHNFTVIRAGGGVYFDTLYAQQYMASFAPQFGATAFGALTGNNTPGFLANGGLQNPNPTNATLTDAQSRALTSNWFGNQRTPYSAQWNVAWEQAIWRKMTFEVKYLGSKQTHLPVYTLLNNPGIVTAQNSLPLYYTTPSQTTLNGLTTTLPTLMTMQSANPFIAAGFTNPLTTIAPDGNAWYHAVAVSLNHRFTGGFQFSGNYTWSHLIDDTTGSMFDLASPTRMRANSLYDHRNMASAAMLWDVGAAFRSYNVIRNVFADFTLSGTYTFVTGQFIPLTGMADTGFANFPYSSVIVNPSGAAGVGTGVTPLFNSAGNVVAYQATNPNARFISGAPGLFAQGNRAAIQLNDVNNWDISASKRFNFMDKGSFELRGDAYNIFNHPQFTGVSSTAIGSRFMTATPGFAVPGSVNFGNIFANFSDNARTLQVAAKIVF